MNNINGIRENWDETKRKLKLKFAMLSDTDLVLEEGKQEELLSRLQAKFGKTKEEIRTIISRL